ncbi:MAG: hypothetical protein K0S86_3902 [Geminicoccaceae bacterium]|nr:hypothetical protein [Geminicoccaceae bacterium]
MTVGERVPGVYVRRMPRVQVYLPNDLHRALKKRRLSASELLQAALRAELRRLELLAETDRYVRGLVERVGRPTARDREAAEGLVERVRRQARRRGG